MSHGIKGSTPKCSCPDCSNLSHSHGLCPKHYQRVRRYGKPIRILADHGMHNTAVYHRWEGINQRCHNPKHDQYRRYGARGILVCKEWRHSFINFYRDMGNLPSPKHQIDRIDSRKGYSKKNCQWLLPVDNVRRSRAAKLTPQRAAEIKRRHKFGESSGVLAKEMGVTSTTITRILRGENWKDVEAL